MTNRRSAMVQKKSKSKFTKERTHDYIRIRHNLELLSKRMMSIPQLENQIKYLKDKNNSNKHLS